MSINRRSTLVGVAALGLVGLAGGGVAWAASDAGWGSNPTTPASTTSYCPGQYGMFGRYSPMTAVANYLGLSRAELIEQMHSGRTFAEIARAQGKSVAGLKSAMTDAMKRALAADKSLSGAQRAAALATMTSHLDAMVNGYMTGMDMADMGAGMMGGAGNGMMGG